MLCLDGGQSLEMALAQTNPGARCGFHSAFIGKGGGGGFLQRHGQGSYSAAQQTATVRAQGSQRPSLTVTTGEKVMAGQTGGLLAFLRRLARGVRAQQTSPCLWLAGSRGVLGSGREGNVSSARESL